MKRELCKRCQNPINTCLCSFIEPTSHDTKVIIVQCDKEHLHPKNTARLLPLVSNNIKVIQASQLNKELGGLNADNSADLLLFPSDSATSIKEFKTTPKECGGSINRELNTIRRLFVIDGTWRKAKKLVITNEQLKTLPHVKLSKNYESAYDIRHTSIENGLSTLEATAYALLELDALSETNAKPFFKLLSGINKQFKLHMPDHVKKRYE